MHVAIGERQRPPLGPFCCIDVHDSPRLQASVAGQYKGAGATFAKSHGEAPEVGGNTWVPVVDDDERASFGERADEEAASATRTCEVVRSRIRRSHTKVG